MAEFSCAINFPPKITTFPRKANSSENRIKLMKLYFHLIISIDIAEKHFSVEKLTFRNIIFLVGWLEVSGRKGEGGKKPPQHTVHYF
jgi:hypothetical protein